MEWDAILWDATLDAENNEIRLTIEGKCDDVDERIFRSLEREGVEVSSIKLRPEGERTTAKQTA